MKRARMWWGGGIHKEGRLLWSRAWEGLMRRSGAFNGASASRSTLKSRSRFGCFVRSALFYSAILSDKGHGMPSSLTIDHRFASLLLSRYSKTLLTLQLAACYHHLYHCGLITAYFRRRQTARYAQPSLVDKGFVQYLTRLTQKFYSVTTTGYE